jgi:hypothetical protein
VDIAAWKKSPSHLRDLWTNDPVFMAFTRVLMATLEPLAPNDNLSIACDDEESTALGMFKLYRRVKQIWPSAKRRMAAISFADDEVFPQLQAADFISSLSRLEGHNKFHGESYDYSALFDTLNHPDPTDRLLVSGICFVSDDNLKSMADDMLELKKGTTT